MIARRFNNIILNSFAPEVIQRLSLVPVNFELEHEIEFPGCPIAHLYFVEEGMASMTTTFEDGSQVEVGMFGFDSMIGVSALMGTKRSLNRVYTQIEGHGFRTSFEDARREFERGEVFHTLALRCVQAQLLQAMQSAGCNAKHHIEQRLARWLLITSDRARRTQFKMSHAFLADMIGSTRSTVSLAAAVLKDEGLIEYSRGQITILDFPELQNRSCECYLTIKKHLANLAEFAGNVP